MDVLVRPGVYVPGLTGHLDSRCRVLALLELLDAVVVELRREGREPGLLPAHRAPRRDDRIVFLPADGEREHRHLDGPDLLANRRKKPHRDWPS